MLPESFERASGSYNHQTFNFSNLLSFKKVWSASFCGYCGVGLLWSPLLLPGPPSAAGRMVISNRWTGLWIGSLHGLGCWIGLLDWPFNLMFVYQMTSTQSDVLNLVIHLTLTCSAWLDCGSFALNGAIVQEMELLGTPINTIPSLMQVKHTFTLLHSTTQWVIAW